MHARTDLTYANGYLCVCESTAVGRPHKKRRLADARERLEPHMPRPSPVSDESRLVIAGAIINARLGGLHPVLPPDGRERIWLLVPHTNNLVGYDLLMNAAADFLEEHPPAVH